MRLRDAIGRLRQTARLMVGVPDYETYLAHRRVAHPGEQALSREEFHRRAIDRRYGRGTSGRCC